MAIRSGLLLGAIVLLSPLPSGAQSIVGNGDTTVISPSSNQFAINSNTTIGPNQFFSFDQFSVSQPQTAIFQNRDGINNVLAKVSGGLPSNLSGQIQFLNGRPNFYLMNPAGIVFGPNAQLNLPAAFTATTASGIGFGNMGLGDIWWDIRSGLNQPNVATLGDPTAFRFSPGTPGAIVNLGAINANNNLSLIGGTVINAGNLQVAGGRLNLVTVAGNNTVQILLPGSPLGVVLPSQAIPALGFTPASLAELITGATPANANGVVINPDGTVSLKIIRDEVASRNVTIKAGDIYTTAIADTTIPDNQPEKIVIQSQGNLYGDRLNAYQSAGVANLTLLANQNIDVGHLSLSSKNSGNSLYLLQQLGNINLSSFAGNVLVSTIDNAIGSISIKANGLFQATGRFGGSSPNFVPTSLRAYDQVAIRYARDPLAPVSPREQIDTIGQKDPPGNFNPTDIQGGNNSPFVVGPGPINGVTIPTWFTRNVSGTVGAIEILRSPDTPPGQLPPNNNPSVVFQDQRFGILPSDTGQPSPGNQQPPVNPGPLPNSAPNQDPDRNQPTPLGETNSPSNNAQRSTANNSRWDKSAAIGNGCEGNGTSSRNGSIAVSTGCGAIGDPTTEDAAILQLLIP